MAVTQIIGRSVLARPFRKIGLAVASQWPFPIEVQIASGRRMHVDLRSAVGRALFVKGEFDPVVFQPILQALRPGGTFIDVGANVGFYTMLALDCIGPDGLVHAFEIDPRPLRCLRRTLRRQRENNVILHEIAVTDQCGKIGLAAGADCGHSHIDPTNEECQVLTITLDAWAARHNPTRVQAIKIDVEGAELGVLRGAQTFLRRHRPVIVCEAEGELAVRFGGSEQGLVALLHRIGYRTRSLEGALSPTIVAEWAT